MSKNYEQLDDDKWYRTKMSEDIICCDCCLTHKVKFKIKDGKLYSKWKRDDKATAGYRRAKEAKKTLKKIK